MTMPKPIYESLPLLYVIGGVAAISTVDSFMSFISGVLLGCSGVMIMILRRNYRVANNPDNEMKHNEMIHSETIER
jgi:hypothetical protein